DGNVRSTAVAAQRHRGVRHLLRVGAEAERRALVAEGGRLEGQYHRPLTAECGNLERGEGRILERELRAAAGHGQFAHLHRGVADVSEGELASDPRVGVHVAEIDDRRIPGEHLLDTVAGQAGHRRAERRGGEGELGDVLADVVRAEGDGNGELAVRLDEVLAGLDALEGEGALVGVAGDLADGERPSEV